MTLYPRGTFYLLYILLWLCFNPRFDLEKIVTIRDSITKRELCQSFTEVRFPSFARFHLRYSLLVFPSISGLPLPWLWPWQSTLLTSVRVPLVSHSVAPWMKCVFFREFFHPFSHLERLWYKNCYNLRSISKWELCQSSSSLDSHPLRQTKLLVIGYWLFFSWT